MASYDHIYVICHNCGHKFEMPKTFSDTNPCGCKIHLRKVSDDDPMFTGKGHTITFKMEEPKPLDPSLN